MRKLKLLLAACALFGVTATTWAEDYLTDFSAYNVIKTAVSNDGTSGIAREFWRGNILEFDVNGTSTELPNGVYSFSVQAVYRGHETGDIPTGIIAYAESDGSQYMTPICNFTDGTPGNNLEGFATAFATEGNYLNTIPYIIVTDGKIKVGVKSMSTQPFCGNGMWFIFNTTSFKVSNVTDNEVLTTALSDVKAQASGLLNSNSDTSTERNALQTAISTNEATAANIVNIKQKIDAYLANLSATATKDKPYDVSYYFTNPKYSIRNLDLVGGLVTSGKTGALGQPFGWTCFDAGGYKDDGSGKRFQEDQSYNWFSTIGNTTELDGNTANYDADKTGGYSIYQRISWNQWAEQTHSAKQTVTLPAGKYKISVPAYASANNDDYKGYVNFTVGGTSYNNIVTAGSWNVYEKEFILAEQTEVSVDMQFNKLRRDKNVGKAYAYFDGVTLLAYGDPLQTLKSELAELQAGIDANYLNNTEYSNIVGTERAALTVAKTATATEETATAYQTALVSVQSAIDAFKAAKPNYDILVAEISKANALGLLEVNDYAANSETTAATALANTQNLKVAEYNYVKDTYQYSVELGEWTATAEHTKAATFNNEHWSGTTHNYKNQDDTNGQGWNAKSWSINFSQDVKLPAGKYVFKVAGRQASGDQVNTSLVVKIGDEILGTVSDFPRSNATRGINKAGETAFEGDNDDFANGGKGYGWEWRYVKFELTKESTVNIAVNSVATDYHQWVSFGDYTLQTDNDANIALITYNVALNNAKTIRDNEDYVNVIGSEKSALSDAIAADATLDKSNKTAIETATNTLNEAMNTFKNAKGSYDTYINTKSINYAELPYASPTKYAAITTAQNAGDASSATDAEEKTNAIIAAYRRYIESNALAEGVNGAEKVTVPDYRFAGLTIDGNAIGAWAVYNQTGGNVQLLNNESFTDGDGNTDYTYVDIAKSDNNYGVKQKITLEPGKYMMTVTARCRSGMGAKFEAFAGGVWVSIPQQGNQGGQFGKGWNDVNVEFYVATTSDIEIGVKSDWGKDIWWSATRFRLVRLGDAVENVEVTAAGYATYTSDYGLDFSETTIKAYTAKVEGDKIVLTKIDKVAAGTPVVLYCEGGKTESIPMLAGEADDATGNQLVRGTGAVVATEGEGVTNYILNNVDNKIGFYKANNQKVAKNRAYLPVSGGTDGARLTIVFADATGVSDVRSKMSDISEEIYNLNGQRVVNAKKGLYIIGGKKKVIK